MAEAAIASQRRQYETIYILNATTDRAAAESISERMKDVITRSKGVLTRVENWGRRRLAYPMNRQTRGVYVYFEYLGGGGLVAEVERNLRLLDAVIKFQTVKTADAVDETRQVNPEDVKFEHVDPDGQDPEETLEQRLGLAPRAGYRAGQEESRYDAMDDDGFADDDGVGGDAP